MRMKLVFQKMRLMILTTLLAMLGLAISAPSAFAELTAKANHDDIKINYDYNGSSVSVSGISDPDVDLIIRISSANTDEELMRKDKEAGVWMNVEKLTMENAPYFYYIRSTKDLDSLLGADELVSNNLGYGALEETIEIKPQQSPEMKKKLLGDYIKYKEDGKLYSQSLGDIEQKKDDAGKPTYYTVFDWPYQAPPGNYTVDVYAVKDHVITDTAQSKVVVEQEGVVKALSDMAQNNGGLYGIAAIGVSLTAGFGVGFVFKGGGGSH